MITPKIPPRSRGCSQGRSPLSISRVPRRTGVGSFRGRSVVQCLAQLIQSKMARVDKGGLDVASEGGRKRLAGDQAE
ncbi:hypothetical protein Droror1_Dr00020078, partial [Drosera rotundifolia]